MIAQKKKVMMMQQAAPEPGGIPITGLVWDLTHNITSSGVSQIGGSVKYAAAAGDATLINGSPSSGTITPQSRAIKATGTFVYGSYTINCFVQEFKDGVWQRRLRIYAGDTVNLTSDTTTIAITYAFAANSGQTMTQAVIDASFAAEWG